MTVTEFNNTGWSGGMKCDYQDKQYDIGSCDFEEKTVGLVDGNTDDIFWVQCEHVTLTT